MGTNLLPQGSPEERVTAGQLEKEEQQHAETGENSAEMATAGNDAEEETVVTHAELPQE